MNITEFETIWNDGITPTAHEIVDAYPNIVEFHSESKMQIFDRYNEINQRCKKNFMHNNSGLLDRHKVSAALMIAICESRPLYNEIKTNPDGREYVFNERLALEVGLQVLKGYLNNNDEKTNIEEFYFPPTNNQNEIYKDVFCRLIRFDIAYNQVSVLSIANILYFIESYTYLKMELLQK